MMTQSDSYESYRKLSYTDIINKLYNLSRMYPDLITVESVHTKYGVPHQFGSCQGLACTIVMVTITDRNHQNPNKPQVYISGSVHGNERLGPHVVAYLSEYLVSNYDSNAFVRLMLQEREIILTPFVNAFGYANNIREELADNGFFYDINRDFPYNRETSDFNCYSTVGARATFKIFQDNLIVSALSFHAGMEAIGYNWGSFNHMDRNEHATEAPDDTMYARVSEILQEQSRVSGWNDIPIGPMTDLIYA